MSLWSVEKIWNDSIAQKRKEPKVRDYIWPGDIGKNFYERYLKMNGEEQDRGYEDRVLRKFSAGIWFEEQIGYILKTIGILEASQDWIEVPADEKHLRVYGRLDYIAGGNADWNMARARVREAKFPEFIETTSMKLIDHFEREYPGGLEKVVLEVKSVNSQVFWSKKDYLAEAYPHHVMQLYTYLKATNIPKGIILYISKDDLTVKEQVITLGDENLERIWDEDVEQMTYYYQNKIEPPKPEDVIFDKRKKLNFQYNKEKITIVGSWVENWEIKWSNYFTKITGCKTEDEWTSKINPIICERNSLLKEKYKQKIKI